MITLDQYPAEVRRTAAHTDDQPLNQKLSLSGMGLAGEAGEVCDILKKVVHHDRPLDEAMRLNICREMGDVLWYLTYLAGVLGLTLDEVANANVEKLRARYPEGFTTEASIAKADEVVAGTPFATPEDLIAAVGRLRSIRGARVGEIVVAKGPAMADAGSGVVIPAGSIGEVMVDCYQPGRFTVRYWRREERDTVFVPYRDSVLDEALRFADALEAAHHRESVEYLAAGGVR